MANNGDSMTIAAIGINLTGLSTELHRFQLAQQSRDACPGIEFIDTNPARNATTVYGYKDRIPFLRDILTEVKEKSPQAEYWGYIHADVMVSPDLAQWIRDRKYGTIISRHLNINTVPSVAAAFDVPSFHSELPDQYADFAGEMLLVHRDHYDTFMSRLPDVFVGMDSWDKVCRLCSHDLDHYQCESIHETPLRHIAHGPTGTRHGAGMRAFPKRINRLIHNHLMAMPRNSAMCSYKKHRMLR